MWSRKIRHRWRIVVLNMVIVAVLATIAISLPFLMTESPLSGNEPTNSSGQNGNAGSVASDLDQQPTGAAPAVDGDTDRSQPDVDDGGAEITRQLKLDYCCVFGVDWPHHWVVTVVDAAGVVIMTWEEIWAAWQADSQVLQCSAELLPAMRGLQYCGAEPVGQFTGWVQFQDYRAVVALPAGAVCTD